MMGRIPYDGVRPVASVVSEGETVLPGPGVKGHPVREGAHPYETHPQKQHPMKGPSPYEGFRVLASGDREPGGRQRPAIWG